MIEHTTLLSSLLLSALTLLNNDDNSQHVLRLYFEFLYTFQVVEDFKKLMVDGLSSCTDEPCKLMYVRCLGNAGLSSTVSIILPFAESPSSSMLASTAIGALRRINKRYLGEQVEFVM